MHLHTTRHRIDLQLLEVPSRIVQPLQNDCCHHWHLCHKQKLWPCHWLLIEPWQDVLVQPKHGIGSSKCLFWELQKWLLDELQIDLLMTLWIQCQMLQCNWNIEFVLMSIYWRISPEKYAPSQDKLKLFLKEENQTSFLLSSFWAKAANFSSKLWTLVSNWFGTEETKCHFSLIKTQQNWKNSYTLIRWQK